MWKTGLALTATDCKSPRLKDMRPNDKWKRQTLLYGVCGGLLSGADLLEVRSYPSDAINSEHPDEVHSGNKFV